MKLVVMLNNNKGNSMGEVLNGLMHLTLGLGHRIDGIPSVNIFVGDNAKIRAFRALAVKLNANAESTTAFSDFPHTMIGGDSEACLERGKKTPESEMNYLAAYYLAESVPEEMEVFLEATDQFVNYTTSNNPAGATLLPQRDDYSDATSGKKIVLVMNPEKTLPELLNACILSSIKVGQTASFAELRLLKVMDADGGIHPNISYHPYAITKAKNTNVFAEMTKNAAANNDLTKHTEDNMASVVFGDRTAVESVCTRENTELFRSKFPLVTVRRQGILNNNGIFHTANPNSSSASSITSTITPK